MELDVSEFFQTLDIKEKHVETAAINAMDRITKDLLAESQKLVPEKEHELRNSGRASVEAKDGKVTGSVKYSCIVVGKNGKRFNKALWMHEFGGRRVFKHPTKPGSQPKYLSTPMRRKSNQYREMLAEAIRKELD